MDGNDETAENQADYVMHKLDLNKNGTIDYNEFLMANLTRHSLSKQRLKTIIVTLGSVKGFFSLDVFIIFTSSLYKLALSRLCLQFITILLNCLLNNFLSPLSIGLRRRSAVEVVCLAIFIYNLYPV